MAVRIKTTISLDAELVKFLREAQRRRGIPRSRIVEEALLAARRREIELSLRAGYEAMADHDRREAEATLAAAREVIK